MAERNYICSELPYNFVNRAAAEPAAQIATVIRLIRKQIQRRLVLNVSPIDTARLQIFTDRLNRRKKLTLLDRERANAEPNQSALLQNQKGFQQSHGVFAARYTNGHTIAIANHPEFADCFAHFAQNCFFEVQLTSGYRIRELRTNMRFPY